MLSIKSQSILLMMVGVNDGYNSTVYSHPIQTQLMFSNYCNFSQLFFF